MLNDLKSNLKEAIKRLVFRPRGLKMGAGSLIRRPWRILNPRYIETGERVQIGQHVILNALRGYNGVPINGHIRLEDDVYIGGYCQIHAMGRMNIGKGCVLSEHVYVSDTAHRLDPKAGPIMQQPLTSKGPVTLGQNVFIGYGCSILPGVTLGDHCIVGTRSVVTRSFPAYSMIAGTPARLIKRYNTSTGLWEPITEGQENG